MGFLMTHFLTLLLTHISPAQAIPQGYSAIFRTFFILGSPHVYTLLVVLHHHHHHSRHHHTFFLRKSHCPVIGLAAFARTMSFITRRADRHAILPW